MPNWKYLIIFLSVEHWSRTYIFTLIQSTMKRKIKASSNFVFPTMLQSMTRLSFSVFEESKIKKSKSKIENWKLKSIFNFCFWAKTCALEVAKVPQGGAGRGNARRTPKPLAALCPPSWMPERPWERVFCKEAANLTVLSSLYHLWLWTK